MAYTALYRKFRPLSFSEMVGQEHITRTLRNQIMSGRVGHAYLFNGGRGTGKTTSAKVLARAINCLNPKDGEPCNECEVCKSILEGNTSDVIEMDAASNNSVENIRQIRQEVVYATVDVKYRVYIIDEVHMLTTSAFNALLKTLEEPPENVVFILATTEQHKIPVTILSRCLRFDFNRISDEEIVKRLKYVLDEEHIEYEEEACTYIAKLADGGMRDALSILDRCISEMDEKLTYDDIQRIVGAIDKQIIQNIVKSVINYDSISANENIDLVIKKGKDLRQLVYELNEEFLNLLIKEENDKERLVRIIDRLSKLDNDIRQSTRPSIVLKACIVEICSNNIVTNSRTKETGKNNGNVDATINMLTTKIANLEKEICSLKNTLANAPLKPRVTTIQPKRQVSSSSKENTESNEQKINKEDMQMFADIDEFNKIVLERGKIKLYSVMAGASIYLAEEYTLVITTNSFAYNVLKMDENVQTIADILSTEFGIDKDVRVELEETRVDNTLRIEKVLEENNINYTKLD